MFLFQLIRDKEADSLSLSSLGLFPLALIVDLFICVAFERSSLQGSVILFEVMHYILFFSYTLLIFLQEASEIIQKTSTLPLSSKLRTAIVFTNMLFRFPSLAIILLSRIFFWLNYHGTIGSKITLEVVTTLLLRGAGLLAALTALRLMRFRLGLGTIAGLGIVLILLFTLPYFR